MPGLHCPKWMKWGKQRNVTPRLVDDQIVHSESGNPSSNTITPPSLSESKPVAPETDTETVDPAEGLWDEAYKKLREKEPGLVKKYEELLLSAPEVTQAGLDDGNTSEREKQLQKFIARKLTERKPLTIKIGDASIEVRKQFDRVIAGVLVIKPLGDALAAMDPIHAGLPWAGVCLLLSILGNDSKQRALEIDGLEEIAILIRCYSEIGAVYLRGRKSGLLEALKVSLIELYRQILEFQVRVACHSGHHAISQSARNTILTVNWDAIIQKIRKSKEVCDDLTAKMNALDGQECAKQLNAILTNQNLQIDGLLQKLQDQHKELIEELKANRQERNDQRQTKEEIECRQIFYTSSYEEYKARNENRVPGTCGWFLTHVKFKDWQESKRSSLLWVSADPGCGKSVLSASLVDNELKSTNSSTTCYFFFKDDNDYQKSPSKAVSALLHQLFLQKPILLKYATPEYEAKKTRLPEEFGSLWSILAKAAEDPEAGEILCVLDALDECEESGRINLIKTLVDFYRNLTGDKGKNTVLKFLVTSRPYFSIERDFMTLTSNLPTIRLAGEEETESISGEIDLVIKARVHELGARLKLNDSVRSSLEKDLLNIRHRTYLWVKLIFEVINCRLDVNTEKKLQRIVGTIPDTLDKAYTAILDRSTDKEQAKKLLHIVVSAVRPLTVREMNVALEIKQSDTSHKDLDLELEESFRTVVRNLCGLFVSVIDSKIYLIHQTAKEFLVSGKVALQPTSGVDSSLGFWKHSLAPVESNLILARICIWYLLFADFEIHPLVVDDKKHLSHEVDQYTNGHDFLDYAAKYWADHFQRAAVKDPLLLQSTLEVCNTQSKRFGTWFQVYWITVNSYSQYSQKFTDLIVESYFGHEAVVRLLLDQKGVELDSKDKDGRTPLSWAAERGHEAVVRLLLEQKGVELDSKDEWGQTPLWWAAAGGHEAVVRLLLEQKGVELDSKDENDQTPLSWAAEGGHEAVVRLLLEQKGVELDSKDKNGQTPLSRAAARGHEAVVRLLLEQKGVELDSKDKYGRTPLWRAAERGHEAVVRLLLEQKGVELDSKGEYGRTPLSQAAARGHEAVVRLLLEQKGVEPDSKDEDGRTPLWQAAEGGHEAVVRLLLEQKGVELDSKDEWGQTPLSLAAEGGHEAVVRLLLEQKGVELDSKDEWGQTPLWWAAAGGHEAVVRLLLEQKGVEPDSKDENGRTPLSLAAAGGHEAVVRLLLEQKGVEPDSKDENGRTPLSWAAAGGHKAVVRLLLEQKGVEPDSKDEDGRTPLSWAAAGGHEAVVRLLLEQKGVEPDSKDEDGRTPLSWAAAGGHKAVVRLLLEQKGVEPDSKDEDGRTPLSWATARGHEAVVRLLELATKSQ